MPATKPTPPVSSVPPMTTAAMASSSDADGRERIARRRVEGEDDARDAGEQAGERVDADGDARNGHAHEFGRVAVPAQRIDIGAEARLVGDENAEREDGEHDHGDEGKTPARGMTQ